MTTALSSRKSTFLATEQWISVPWLGGNSKKDALQYLLDHVVNIPALLEQMDQYRSQPGSDLTDDSELQKQALISWALSLHRSLLCWKSDYADTYPRGPAREIPQNSHFPIYRPSPTVMTTITIPTALTYPDLTLARSLCLYHAAQLILLGTRLLCDGSLSKTRPTHVNDICRSVQWIFMNASAPFMPQLEFSLQVAYDTSGEGSSERAFIQEVFQYMRDRRRI